ncbi:MAG: crossover junction endodeoxyribonuclease RuvC [Lentisphaeria bacterium]
MRILCVDTSLRCSGVAVIEFNEKGNATILQCGFIKTPASKKVSECLRRLSGGISELIEEYSPNEVAIEGIFYHKFARSAMVLGMARGVVVGICASKNLPVYEYAPKSAKLAVTGNGAASKEQVAFMMANMFKIKINQIPLDATDALAIGVCHYQQRTLPEEIYKKLEL